MPIQRENRNYVLHDDEKCYCKDTLKHLRRNEQKYYSLKNVVNTYDLSNENMKKCSYYVVRQRLIEWLIVVQDYYSSSEETLEMSIRLFDYIYFKDLYSNHSSDNILNEDANNTLINKTFSENSDDDYFQYSFSNYSDEESINERLDDNNNSQSKENKENKHCVCGSYHNGWLQLEELQLVALTCFFLSAKFWERFPPKMSKLINLTEYCYSENQLIQKEKQILSIINFDLKIPLVTQYLEFYVLHETVFLLNKIIPICHYLYNLTLTETRFLNRLASSLAAVILTLAKMVLCSFASNEPEESNSVYDTSLFAMKDFKTILNDIWSVFYNSIVEKESFKLQKKKFSDQKYSYLPLYIESVDLTKIHKHYEQLDKYVNSVISSN